MSRPANLFNDRRFSNKAEHVESSSGNRRQRSASPSSELLEQAEKDQVRNANCDGLEQAEKDRVSGPHPVGESECLTQLVRGPHPVGARADPVSSK